MTADERRAGGRRVRRMFWSAVPLVAASPAAWPCPACVPLVEAGIYGENFVRHLLLMILPVALLVAIAAGVYGVDRIRDKKEKSE